MAEKALNHNRSHIGIIAALAVAVVVLGGLAVWLNGNYSRIKAQMAATRERAMLEVVDALGDVEIRLGKLLVSSSATQGVTLLGDIQRQTQLASTNLAQLPIRHDAVSGTVKFVSQLGDYANVLSENLTQGRPLSDSDLGQLEQMLRNCSLLNLQLRGVERQLASGQAVFEESVGFWSDGVVENAPPLEAAAGSSNGIDYPALTYDGPFSDGRHQGAPKGLTGGEITRDEALQRAAAFVGIERVQSTRFGIDSAGVIPAYGIIVETQDASLNVQITKQGGHVLWMMPEHAAFGSGLSAADCAVKAYEFLVERGYGHMEPNYWQVYDGLAVINFAAVQGDVLLYPDLVKVQVRTDTGAVVGIEANNYLMNHQERSQLEPTLTEEEAREMVSDRLHIERARLCLIPTERGERLCYEFGGTWTDSYYLVYIDAVRGDEVNILKIVDVEGGQLTA